MTEAGAGVGPGAVTVSGRVSFGEQYRATRRIVARSRAGLMAYLFFLGSPLVLAILVSGCAAPPPVTAPVFVCVAAPPLPTVAPLFA